jgi:hypothetical protein
VPIPQVEWSYGKCFTPICITTTGGPCGWRSGGGHSEAYLDGYPWTEDIPVAL